MSTKNQLAVIHILKKEYGLTDEEYENLMYDNFDVTSSRDLNENEAEAFIHKLNYKYNESYKRGYDNAISEVCGRDLDEQFRFFYQKKYNKLPSVMELYLFDKLNDVQKADTIKDLKIC